MMPPVNTDAPCVPREWDTGFFGLSIAQVTEPPRTAAQAEAIDAWARGHRTEGLYLFIDGADVTLAALAEGFGFTRVEERHVFVAPTRGASARLAAVGNPPRIATAADLPHLKALARISHHNTRFYTDPHFDSTRCDAMYEHWVDRHFHDPEVGTWATGPEGNPTGYYTVDAEGVGGLMAIHPDHRQQRLGTSLLAVSLAWLEQRGVESSLLRTQSTNEGARRMFLKHDAYLHSIEFVFHKWYDKSPA